MESYTSKSDEKHEEFCDFCMWPYDPMWIPETPRKELVSITKETDRGDINHSLCDVCADEYIAREAMTQEEIEKERRMMDEYESQREHY